MHLNINEMMLYKMQNASSRMYIFIYIGFLHTAIYTAQHSSSGESQCILYACVCMGHVIEDCSVFAQNKIENNYYNKSRCFFLHRLI